MNSQAYLFNVLQERFLAARHRNPQYSLRSLARRVDVSASTLSEFFQGKRKLSRKLANKIAQNLYLSDEQIGQMNNFYDQEKKRPKKERSVETQLTRDQYFLVADDIYYSILCLTETVDFQSDIVWIANRLKTTPKRVHEAVERMKRIGMLKEIDGKLYHENIFLNTSEDIANLSLKKRHEKNLEAARESLFTDPVLERDFSFMTLAIDKSKLPIAKKMLRKFRQELTDFLEDGEQTEVYEMCFQLFPKSSRGELQ
jgi:uncharacterized protein (TIGR02147 family)